MLWNIQYFHKETYGTGIFHKEITVYSLWKIDSIKQSQCNNKLVIYCKCNYIKITTLYKENVDCRLCVTAI